MQNHSNLDFMLARQETVKNPTLISLDDNEDVNSTSFRSLASSQCTEIDGGRFYELCMSAGVSESNEDEVWNNIRTWLLNASKEERAMGVCQREMNHKTALHEVCNHPNPPIDVVANILESSSSHEVAKAVDKDSWIPLHIACNSGVSTDVIQLLVDAYPDGTTQQDKHGRTPLHFLLSRESFSNYKTKSKISFPILLQQQESSEIQNAIQSAQVLTSVQRSLNPTNAISETISAANITDFMNDMLPIHYACAYGVPTSILEVLVDANPESINSTDKFGRTPLHYSMRNGDNSESPRHLRLLIENDPNHFMQEQTLQELSYIVDMEDSNGALPLELLGKRGNEVDKQNEIGREAVTECLLIYLESEPLPTTKFVTTLQKLPQWLKDTAVMNTYVKTVMNKKISQRIPTMFLLLDGMFAFTSFAAFASIGWGFDILDAQNCTMLQNDVDQKSFCYFLYIGAAYFLFHELLQMLSLYSLGTLRTWLTNGENWIDVLLISLLFATARIMSMTDAKSEDEKCPLPRKEVKIIYVLLISSMAIKIFFYLKSFREKFAVFVNGVIYVVQRLFIFGFALFCVLLAFSEIFFLLYHKSEKCQEDPEFAHCDQFRSLLRVYSNLMGEVYPKNYTDKPEAKYFFMMYILVAIILLSNVLIAVVTDNYKVIKNTRASMVFWSNRLDLAAEMDAICRVMTLFSPFRYWNKKPVAEEERYDYIIWKNFMSLFFEHHEMGLAQMINGEFWIILIYRILAIVLLPLWFLIGFISAGLLWPPQVRHAFMPNIGFDTRVDTSIIIAKQITELRREVHKNYVEVKSELKQDRKELKTMKTETEALQSDILADMMQIKEILSTLLELRKEENDVKMQVTQ